MNNATASPKYTAIIGPSYAPQEHVVVELLPSNGWTNFHLCRTADGRKFVVHESKLKPIQPTNPQTS